MRGKLIVRISRRNEFNRYWVFFLAAVVVLGITSLKVETYFQAFAVVYASLIILIIALLYQGFEMVKQ